jgi:excisionase family DNA binding protein
MGLMLFETQTLTAEEAAQVLKVKTERVYELCRLGILPHVRLGRQVRIEEQQFLEWMRNGGQALPGGWKREQEVR